MRGVHVKSDNVSYTAKYIEARYTYHTTHITANADGDVYVEPVSSELKMRTERRIPRTGVMLVGWGGNNGSTLTAGILANRDGVTWRTKRGLQRPTYFGSVTQASTINVGLTSDLHDTFVPLKSLVPMLSPDDIVLGGWDCSAANLGEAMRRAAVLEVPLQDALYEQMQQLKPLPAVFDIAFVATNQAARADNVMKCYDKWAQVSQLRDDIRAFKAGNGLEKVIVLWTANTERMSDHVAGIHDTADNLVAAVKRNESEIAPSVLYAMAAILENCCYINGAPQNTICGGLVELARRHGVFLVGDDFKSGQTKMKSALVELFVGAGIKPECIASYNHLGNNDGYNLSAPLQFRSKEVTKSNVVDDMVASNEMLFPRGSAKPDHCIVIKYMPFVGDSKRAMDEYSFSIFMGGHQTVAVYNMCEDSLLAAPLMLDLVILTELMSRVEVATTEDETDMTYEHMDTVLSVLSYFLKAPASVDGAPVVNALNRQKQALENVLRALVGLPPQSNMMLECCLPRVRAAHEKRGRDGL